MRDAQNKMYNMVQGYAEHDRIPTLHMSDKPPTPGDILAIPLESYLPSELDEVDLRYEFTVIISSILCENKPVYQPLSNAINWHIKHTYHKESASKSRVVS